MITSSRRSSDLCSSPTGTSVLSTGFTIEKVKRYHQQMMTRGLPYPTPGNAGRLLVVMCDGTGNEVEGDLSNVLKLYRACVRDIDQRVFYSPGVGTIENDSSWRRLKQRLASVFALATGYALDDDILDGYRFLCMTYRPGDRIMLFGFSRGAYAVRALGGLLNAVGLLSADQANLAGQALNSYKRSAERGDLRGGWDFGRVLQTRKVEIEFMGLWDTVASVIVPRPDRLYLPSLRRLPYTGDNPAVRCVRHAVALDERRRMFRLNRWGRKRDGAGERDDLQMLFPGVHADIGGGYPEHESGLAKFPLLWIAKEAESAGLRLDRQTLHRMAGLDTSHSAPDRYVPPDANGPMHESLRGAWWILEWLPRSARWRETRCGSLFGYYLPRGERRGIPADAQVHPSVLQRMSANRTYRPKGIQVPQDASTNQ